jgi:hypothetical protein
MTFRDISFPQSLHMSLTSLHVTNPETRNRLFSRIRLGNLLRNPNLPVSALHEIVAELTA